LSEQERRGTVKKVLGLVLVWGVVLGGGGVAFKYLILDRGGWPEFGAAATAPPSTAPQTPKLRLALDSFSGYCIFRSPEFKKKLADKGIDYDWVDDQADYGKRMETLKDGSTPLAVFTIDALITQTPHDGEPPAAIVLLIDESRGADAMVSYARGLPNIDALNNEAATIVLVEDSPSETLARVVRSRFKLPNLPKEKKKYIVPAKNAGDAYSQFLEAKPGERKAFVLWEPYVSKALKERKDQGAQLLVDSSQFKGFIVDVLVVQQSYLRQHREQIQTVVRAYLEVLHDRQRSPDGMADLVLSDADVIGEKMTRDEAVQVAKGVRWKNTVENYAHLGLLPADRAKGLEQVGEMIKEITEVLQQTSEPGVAKPGVARSDKLVDEDVMRRLYELPKPLYLDTEIVGDEVVVQAIAADRWKDLKPVGSLRVPPIEFYRNKATLTEEAEQALTDLAAELKRWPQYYLRIEGQTLAQGDPKANMELAEQRAAAVKRFLVEQQVAEHRMDALGMPPGKGAEVRFVVLQLP
jgi:outer membrane protein OmpA-like peptidoglycan-associated protein